MQRSKLLQLQSYTGQWEGMEQVSWPEPYDIVPAWSYYLYFDECASDNQPLMKPNNLDQMVNNLVGVIGFL